MGKTVKRNDYPPRERPARRKRENRPLWVDGPEIDSRDRGKVLEVLIDLRTA